MHLRTGLRNNLSSFRWILFSENVKTSTQVYIVSTCCRSINIVHMMFKNKFSRVHALIVGTGGLFMERWIRQFGSRQTRRDIGKLRKGNIEQRMMRDTITTRINVKNRVGFYVFVLQSLNHRGNSVKSQLFYLSMLWRHKGLSESGSQILAKLSLAVSPSYYLSQIKFQTQVETNKFR